MIDQLLTNPNPERKLVVFQGLSSTMGVYYYRTKQFFDYLTANYSDIFEFVLIDRPFNPDDLPLLEKASIVNVHKIIHSEDGNSINYLRAIKSNDGKFVVDNDDYWLLNSTHPSYNAKQNREVMGEIVSTAKHATAVTVASDELAKEIKKYNPNVLVQYNCYNPNVEQFVDNSANYPRTGLKTIGYVGGSSHANDFKLLDGVFSGNRDHYRVLVAGWDTRGGNYELKVNDELVKDLGVLFTREMFEAVKASNGDINKVPGMPAELKTRYAENMIVVNFKPMQPQNTPYFYYEQVLTDNWKNVSEETKQLLFDNFQLQQDIERPEITRIWTKDVNEYCKVYDQIDIVLAPLQTSTFNNNKSALKLIEAATRALPVICSDVAPYQEIGRHMENCYMVKNDTLQKKTTKAWTKAIKYMLDNPDHAIAMGKQLQKDVLEKYNLGKITAQRIELFKQLTQPAVCEDNNPKECKTCK